MIQLGIIGLGIGRVHLKATKDLSNVKVTSICDTDEKILDMVAQTYHIEKVSTDYRDMLADPTVDAVIVGTPDHLHCEMVCAALRAGKHVLCEKPIALHVDECRQMLDTAKETGKLLMAGQVVRMTPSFIEAKRLIDEGYLGDLYFIESEYAHDYSHMNAWAYNWRKDPLHPRHPVTGGGCHAVDLVRWLTGKDPVEVYAYAMHKCLTDWPCADSAISIMKFEEGLAGKVYVSTGCKREYTMRTVIYGTKGTIIVDNTSDHLSLYVSEHDGSPKFAGRTLHNLSHTIPVKVNNHNFGAEIREFCDCIENGKEPSIPAIEGLKTVAVCEAIIEAAETGVPTKPQY